MIVKEDTTISSVLHDNAQLAQKLREAEKELADTRARGGKNTNAGELERRVLLYERMINLKNEQRYFTSFFIGLSFVFPSYTSTVIRRTIWKLKIEH